MKTNSQNLIVVLGMHRGGTSAITRGLKVLGVHLGNNLMPPAKDNPKGYWEDLDIYALNAEMLDFLHSDWHFLTPIQAVDIDGLRRNGYFQKAAELLQKKTDGVSTFGFKDPRMAKLLPFWKTVFAHGQFKTHYVVVIRHPLSVCQSLAKRNGFDLEKCYLMWLDHTINSLTCTNGENRIVVDYDRLMNSPETELARVANKFQLQIDHPELEKFKLEFLDNQLRHTVYQLDDLAADEAAPPIVREVYSKALDVAANKVRIDDAAFRKSITRWGEELSRLKSVLVFADKLEARIVERDQGVQVLTTKLTEKEQSVQALSAQVAEREQSVQALSAQVAEKEQSVRALSARVDEKEQAVRALSTQVTEKERMVQELNSRLIYIFGTKAWRLIQVLWKIRAAIIPHGSRRARGIRKILAGLRSVIAWGRNARSGFVNNKSRNTAMRTQDDKQSNLALDRLAKMAARNFNSPINKSPTVSIIIPVYNQIEFTLNCLLSIASSQDQTDFEIIIADDASNDRTQELIPKIKGIRHIRSSVNQGFLANCNSAAKKANGKYVAFLNNDTRVHSHWLDNLLATFSLNPTAGLVGSKLILPNGKLQEAGSVIWADGSAMNYGRGEDPQSYLYNYVREADYVSGASIMLPKTLWESLGGFDQKYMPAYYEDVDLAFKVRQAGKKVFYQPFSQVTHFEGGTNGMDLEKGIKRYQVANQETFFHTWENVIAGHGSSHRIPDYIQRNRYVKGQILFVDDGTPLSDRYAGAFLSEFYMGALREAGYAVTFLPHIDLRYSEKYTRALQNKGIECIYQPYASSSQDYIKQNGHRFNYVIISRANVASETIDYVKEFAPGAKIIFNTIDLHFLRFARAAQLSGKDKDLEAASQAKESELSIMRKADCTLVVSEQERLLLSNLLPQARVAVVPFPSDIFEPRERFEARRDVVFLGGFMHKPNVDAVIYFAKDIWPLIAKKLPAARLVIAGADVTKEIKQLESGNILVKGFVDNLDFLFAASKLSVAPLRYGAGIKGKVLTSLGYGVPCVATSIACEGIGVTDGTNILIADSPEAFAAAVIKIYTTKELWTSLSQKGQNLIRQNYSRPVVASRLLSVLKGI